MYSFFYISSRGIYVLMLLRTRIRVGKLLLHGKHIRMHGSGNLGSFVCAYVRTYVVECGREGTFSRLKIFTHARTNKVRWRIERGKKKVLSCSTYSTYGQCTGRLAIHVVVSEWVSVWACEVYVCIFPLEESASLADRLSAETENDVAKL